MSDRKPGVKVQRAVISVSDKSGIVELAACLARNGIDIVSTGGTASTLRDAGIKVIDVAEVTGNDEAFGGRVKTLGHKLLGGILFDRDDAGQVDQARQMGIVPIDLVVVNFYDFASAVSKDATMAELVESIDIGGPTMVRSAAKNHRHVAVVVDPGQYPDLIKKIDGGDGVLDEGELASLAAKAFEVTSRYEAQIASRFAGNGRQPQGEAIDLRYGENPHQSATATLAGQGLRQIGGGQLSYNNLQDAAFAWRTASEHDGPTCAIVKHAIPCGVASAENIAEAFGRALAADPVSAYGGVVACNAKLDMEALTLIRKTFFELVVCPEYSDDVIGELAQAKRLRSIYGPLGTDTGSDMRVLGGLRLRQDQDRHMVEEGQLQVVSKAKPSKQMLSELMFAWKVAKHTRSNAVVLAKDNATIGIGAGQTSRVEAAEIAVMRAKAKGHDIAGSVAASDAFFPFADGMGPLVASKVAAVIQPGGSKRDGEVIAAADEAGMVMVLTGVRHFNH